MHECRSRCTNCQIEKANWWKPVRIFMWRLHSPTFYWLIDTPWKFRLKESTENLKLSFLILLPTFSAARILHMDCSLGRHRNPFCYIFSFACLLLPVCMWWRDVISAHSAETSDNSHQTAWVSAAFTASTGTPWIWRRSTCGVTQKNISLDAGGVGKLCAWLGEGAGKGCPWRCVDATKHAGTRSSHCNVKKTERALGSCRIGMDMGSGIALTWQTVKGDFH